MHVPQLVQYFLPLAIIRKFLRRLAERQLLLPDIHVLGDHVAHLTVNISHAHSERSRGRLQAFLARGELKGPQEIFYVSSIHSGIQIRRELSCRTNYSVCQLPQSRSVSKRDQVKVLFPGRDGYSDQDSRQLRIAVRVIQRNAREDVGVCAWNTNVGAGIGAPVRVGASLTFVRLTTTKSEIEIYWLPPYSPSLNLIERLWGHLKRTILANVLYKHLDDLVAAFRTGVRRITGHRDGTGFMFNHDDLTAEIRRQTHKQAA